MHGLQRRPVMLAPLSHACPASETRVKSYRHGASLATVTGPSLHLAASDPASLAGQPHHYEPDGRHYSSKAPDRLTTDHALPPTSPPPSDCHKPMASALRHASDLVLCMDSKRGETCMQGVCGVSMAIVCHGAMPTSCSSARLARWTARQRTTRPRLLTD